MNSEKTSFLNRLIKKYSSKLEKLPFIGGFFSEGSMKQSSLNLFIAQAVYTFTIFFIDILLARTLGGDEFGIWKHVLLLANMVTLILLGLPLGFSYYANLEKEKKRAHLNNVIAAITIISSVFLLILLAGLNKVIGVGLNDEYIIGALFLYPIIVIAIGLYNCLEMLLIIDKKTSLLPRSNVVFGIIYFLAALGIAGYYYFYGIEPFFLAILIVSALLISHLSRSGYLLALAQVRLDFSNVDFSLIKKYLIYGIPIYLATFVGLLNIYIDQIIVSNFESLTTFGVYAVGAKGFPLLPAVSVVVAQSIFPQLMNYQNAGENHKAQALWLKASVKASYLLYPIIIVLMILTPYLIRFIYGESFIGAVEIFQTYLISLIFRHNGYGRLLMIRDENKWLMIFMIISFVSNIIISLILYSRIGIMGVVWGTILSGVVNVVLILSKEKMLGRYLKAFFIDNIALGLMIVFIVLSVLFNWF